MNNRDTFIKMLKIHLDNHFSEKLLTDNEFRNVAYSFRDEISALYNIPNDQLDNIIFILQEHFLTDQTEGVILEKKNDGHIKWYKTRKEQIDHQYSKRYKEYLITDKYWKKSNYDTMDSNTDDVMNLIGDPSNNSEWIRKGLLLGDVQSGKTSIYTLICNKAIDSGYKVIIVLAGLTNALRRQTQLRLEKELVGKTRIKKDNQVAKSEVIGVGNHGKVDNQFDVITSDERDFSKKIAEAITLNFDEKSAPKLFVIKKNKSVLENLFNWLPNTISGKFDGQIHVPVLLIDDESDNASINTKTDEDPTTINFFIRNILALFKRSTYLGVTATPFANIFINPDVDKSLFDLDDLFPDHFIYYMPPSSTYQGSLQFFSYQDIEDENSLLIEIDDRELQDSFKYGHKKNLEFISLPESLEKALLYFVLTLAIRDYKGQMYQHKSMLINVSRFTDVQIRLAEAINDWLLYDVKNAIINHAKLSYSQMLRSDLMVRLNSIWNEFDLSTLVGLDFGYIANNYLCESLQKLEIRIINQKSKDKLDYELHDEGLSVIAIGGNALSRGVTLEGLTVTYFYRNSQTYDTLMQMGRWFGYRHGYKELVKLWISPEASAWYQHITEATEELKREIIRMTRNDRTPRDFGLKVKGHPDALIPTARNKMKSVAIKNTTVDIDIAGLLIESPRLPISFSRLDENEKSVIKFISILDNIGVSEENLIWRNVNSNHIAQLLSGFNSHDWNWYFDTRGLMDYILENDQVWDVAIAQGSSKEKYILSIGDRSEEMNPEIRMITKSTETGSFLISGSKVKVGSGESASLGLNVVKKEELKEKYKTLYYPNDEKINYPDSIFLHTDRNPILIIHIIEPSKVSANDLSKDILKYGKHIFALGLGFINNDDYEKDKKPKKMKVYLNKIADIIEKNGEENGDDIYVD